MSEQHLLEKGGEYQLAPKGVEASNEHIKERIESEAGLAANSEHGTDKHIESHRSEVEKQQAILGSNLDHLKAEHEEPKNTHPLIASLQLKTAAWSRQMTRTRKRLNDSAFSKVIHNPVVDKPSELIGKTIARPQGMLWGSIIAFIGTSALLWTTNHYGYEFNYLLVVLLFIGGSLIGTAVEGLTYLTRKNR